MTALLELTRSERLIKLLSFEEDSLVAQCAIPAPGSAALVPRLRVYRRVADGSWRRQWSVRSSCGVLAAASELVYSARTSDGYELRARDEAGIDVTWKTLPGRPIAMAFHRPAKTLATIVEVPSAKCPSDPTAFVAVGEHITSIEGIRRGSPERRLMIVRPATDASPVKLLLRDGGILTGQLAYAPDGRIILGVQRDHRDGSRRFGFVVLSCCLTIEHEIFDAEHDLTEPVIGANGIACVATSRPADDSPIGQSAVCIAISASGWQRRAIAEGWVKPKAWLGADGLLCIVDAVGERNLLVYNAVEHEPCRLLDWSRNVSDLLVSGDRVASLTSTPFDPPSITVHHLTSDAEEVVEHAAYPNMPRPDVRFLPTMEGADQVGGIRLCEGMHPRRRGLLAMFHGGPMKGWGDWSWRWNPWPFVEHGFTVALIDAPMSVGYGRLSLEIGWRKWRTGLARVAAQQVQRARLESGTAEEPVAAMGGSFGGYLAIAVAAAVEAAVVIAHAPPTDLQAVAAGSDAAWQWIREYGDPASNRALYEEQSVTPVDVPISTRILLSHGLADDLVPVHQTIALHRSLTRRGVPSELMLFPDEGHALLRPRNVANWLTRVLNGLDESFRYSGENGSWSR